MKRETVEQLVAINRTFYREMATAFSNKRRYAWQGYARLQGCLPDPCARFLDVGCGDGRLGRYLLEQQRIAHYTGVDYSSELMAIGRPQTVGDFYERNLLAPDFLAGLGRFDAIACMATLHHIPGRDNRVRVLQQLSEHLAPHGRMIVTTFQFMSNERQRRKIVTWESVGIDPAAVEPSDYLMSFRTIGVRHVNMITAAALDDLLADTDLTVVEQWRSDGKEGDLNLYTVLEKIV